MSLSRRRSRVRVPWLPLKNRLQRRFFFVQAGCFSASQAGVGTERGYQPRQSAKFCCSKQAARRPHSCQAKTRGLRRGLQLGRGRGSPVPSPTAAISPRLYTQDVGGSSPSPPTAGSAVVLGNLVLPSRSADWLSRSVEAFWKPLERGAVSRRT